MDSTIYLIRLETKYFGRLKVDCCFGSFLLVGYREVHSFEGGFFDGENGAGYDWRDCGCWG